MDGPRSAQDKIALIKSNLQEIPRPEIIGDVIVKQGRPLRIYWSISLTLIETKLVF